MEKSGTTTLPHRPGGSSRNTESAAAGYRTFDLGDFTLESGATIPSAWLAYQIYGEGATTTPQKPVVVYPTWYSGGIADNAWLIGAGRALDPARYLIVVPALIGNGESVSPSNTRGAAWRRVDGGGEATEKKKKKKKLKLLRRFPRVTVRDNVTAQHRLLTTGLGLHLDHRRPVRLVLGWSMAAAQTYQWLTQFPALVERAAPFCGSARTSPHNWVFLEGVKAALMAPAKTTTDDDGDDDDDDDDDEKYAPRWDPRQKDVALRAVGRVYAGWGLSQDFYRERLHETRLGFRDLEDFMVNFWEKWALSKDPENLLHMLHTWQDADCSRQPPYDGDLSAAMAAIRARTLVLPGRTDLYFPPEDSVNEVACMRPGVGKCVPFPSIWGHWAGGPGTNPADVKWLDDKLKELLEDDESW